MRLNINLPKFIFMLLILVLTGCLNKPNQLQMQSTQEIEALGKTCTDIEKRQIKTWDMRDPEKLRDIYTEDIVHFDSHPAYVGIDQVVDMANMMFSTFTAWKMDAGDSYISREKCLGTWINWGIMGFTQENPLFRI